MLARGMKTNWEPNIQKALEEGRLLIVTPFGEHIKRASTDTAAVRNELMIELADEVVIGYSNPMGTLSKQLDLRREKNLIFLT